MADPEQLTSDELLDLLAVSPERFDRWLTFGLPHTGKGKGRRFDPHGVYRWLADHDLAGVPAVADSQDDAGRFFQRTGRQIRRWIAEGCPAGEPIQLYPMFMWARDRGLLHGAPDGFEAKLRERVQAIESGDGRNLLRAARVEPGERLCGTDRASDADLWGD